MTAKAPPASAEADAGVDLEADVDLAGRLDELSTTLFDAADAERSIDWGPVPVRLRSDDPAHVDDIARHLAPGLGAWGPIDVATVAAGQVGLGDLPAELRPEGNTLAVARLGDIVAFASGPEASLWILNTARSSAVRWVTRRDAIPQWERNSPLQVAGRWWAAQRNAATVHCGAVGTANGAVLLVGDSGAGKSTTSLACVGSDLDVFGDDFCFVDAPSPDGGPGMVHTMYRLGKIDDNGLDLLPQLRSRIVGVGLRGKSLIELDPIGTPSLPIRAVCHVVQDPTRPTGVEPMSRMAALRAVAPSTLFHVRLFEQETWATLSAIAASVPCHRLHVNALDAVPSIIEELI